mmetsp:Transcript_21422/g.31845  ORF Transcript_21422/g.31845 Transcript_21422/m.31845 type:complete len:84 (-) Transcript_21422:198-449(-)
MVFRREDRDSYRQKNSLGSSRGQYHDSRVKRVGGLKLNVNASSTSTLELAEPITMLAALNQFPRKSIIEMCMKIYKILLYIFA